MRWERLARWSMWFERRADAFELALPYGLREVAIRVHPSTLAVPGDALEMEELGPIGAWLAELHDPPEARLLGPGALPAGYIRWRDTFERPGPESLADLEATASESGLRLSLLVEPGEVPPPSPVSFPEDRIQICTRVEDATGDVILPIPKAASLAPHALAAIVCVFATDPGARIVHTDEELFDTPGGRPRPSFKPSWSPELLRARNYLPGLVAFHRSVLPPGLAGPLDRRTRYRLLLELGEGTGPRQIRRLPAVLASLPESAAVEAAADREVLVGYLRGHGVDARVENGAAPGVHHVRHALPSPVPRVDVIVPTRNAGELVDVCVRSLRSRTTYGSFQITLVDNGSEDPSSLAVFERLAREGIVHLRRDPRPFNFAAINNLAVRETSGEVVCLLNNDVEAVHADWLEEMVAVALRPGVGAVGAKLLYPDGRIQHGGVLVGVYDAADHLYSALPGDAVGLDQGLLVRRETSAVTAACLVVRRALYEQVGGLDEALPVGFNDVDFCLKLRALGLRNIWTPHARLIHHESATRGRAVSPEQKAQLARDAAALQERWHTEDFEDPYYSPNLSLDWVVPELAWAPRRRAWALGCGT
jgi:GT2 family glycosyltransferase